jgi:ferrous iron transport protein B
MVSVDVMLGRQPDVGKPDVVVCIVDASNLERNLYLVSQVLDLKLPTILVLNMSDLARSRDVSINVESLRKKLSIPIVQTEAHRKLGLNDLRRSVMDAVLTMPVSTQNATSWPRCWRKTVGMKHPCICWNG